ncbi:SpoIID/LytB domain-containing protein [Deinococcus depolymerans]|uniref:SpoIID/LytB domain-containing protein n=1 Tax=Deinococcus depolymerans TaxID=392408 RepID=A0ABN1C3Q6_9DEIO
MRSCLRSGALLLAALLLGPGSASALNVRVLVASGPQLSVRVPSAPAPATGVTGALTGGTGALPAPALPTSAWTVGVTGTGGAAQLTLNGQPTGSATLYLPPGADRTVEIAGRTYRGGVQLRAEQGGVQGVNVVDIEDYLRAVVPAEMPASWPAAALQAQAVIARTYVSARINPAAPYDTCATESCQVYPGLSAEKPATDAAVTATRTQVVAFGSRAASTYFSSDSGGFTASSAEVWGRDVPYLTARPDPFSAGSPRARWQVTVPLAKVQAVAAQYGGKTGPLTSVTVTRLSESGRPAEILLVGAAGALKLSGANAGGFIRSLGASGTRVTLAGLNPLVISGSGAGHGVGLSQYGALGLARAGYDHLHVLGFYYPGTVLGTLSAQAAPTRPGIPDPAPALALGPALPQPASLAPLLARAGTGSE